MLLAIDGVRDDIDTIRPYLEGLQIETVKVPEGSSPSCVRRAMLEAARQLDVDVLVFADCDDELEPDALATHVRALETAEFSYGDQILVDAQGRRVGRNLYDPWQVPDTATRIDALLDGNFVGFSGAAVRAPSVTAEVAAVPSETLASDWWVFSRLLLDGAAGRRTERAVVRYRQHAGNIHGGATISTALPEVRRRARIADLHFTTLPDAPGVVHRRAAMKRLLDRLSSDAESMRPAIEAACRRPACWYADVIALALQLDADN